MAEVRFPAVGLAVEFIRRHLDNGSWRDATYLPNIQVLARSAGVSPVTMWKALRHLQEAGLVRVIHGQGVRLAVSSAAGEVREAAAPAGRSAQSAKHEQLKDAIFRDILNGVHAPGKTMPSLKEMAHTYGACYQTLKKALSALVAGKFIVPHKRTYQVPALAYRRSNATVVLLGWSYPAGPRIMMRTPWSEDMVRTLEAECSRVRLNLEKVGYVMQGGPCPRYNTGRASHLHQPPADDSILGYILWGECPDRESMLALDALMRLHKPVALLQEGTELPIPPRTRAHPLLKVFSVATNAEAGRQVGRFLLERGHRHVAYISVFHRTDWSQNRYAGLNEIYGASPDLTLSRVASPGYLYPYQYLAAIKPSIAAQVYSGMTPAAPAGAGFVERVFARGYVSLMRALENEALRILLDPLFDRALALDGASAWVCANDLVAIMAKEYLTAHAGIKPMPAIIGFDDSSDALRNEITSYNVNIPAGVHAMLSYVLSPVNQRRKAAQEPVEISGVIVERQSTRTYL